MNITHFTVLVNLHSTPKNSLEKALHKWLKTIDRKTIEFNSLEEFKKQFQLKINELNETYARCKPFRISFYSGIPLKQDVIIHGLGSLNSPMVKLKVSTLCHISSVSYYSPRNN